jgi:nucleoside-triphosphatase
MSIYIFSRPVRCGKTTELLQWCNLQKNVCGILMPDIDGSRKMLNVTTKEIFDAECVDVVNTNEPLTSIGKYNFYTKALEKANYLLQDAISQNPDWLVIDEAGKLELKGEGFYKSVTAAVKRYDNKNEPGSLLVTVRESLCEEVISFFNIKNFKIIDNLGSLK